MSFIISNNLAIVNWGDEPTFLTSNRKQVLDINLVSSDFSNNLRDCFESHECSLSDYRYITFTIDTKEPPSGMTFPVNRRSSNWTIFGEKLRI